MSLHTLQPMRFRIILLKNQDIRDEVLYYCNNKLKTTQYSRKLRLPLKQYAHMRTSEDARQRFDHGSESPGAGFRSYERNSSLYSIRRIQNGVGRGYFGAELALDLIPYGSLYSTSTVTGEECFFVSVAQEVS